MAAPLLLVGGWRLMQHRVGPRSWPRRRQRGRGDLQRGRRTLRRRQGRRRGGWTQREGVGQGSRGRKAGGSGRWMGEASSASGGRNRWRQASVGARGEMRRGGRGGGRSSRGEDRKGPEDLDCGLGLAKMKGEMKGAEEARVFS
ncbi:hypothetical protein BRADI_4g07945v3 [Brachypodium distachyon]|uniref:Uncharacterized protein n=1 Tax=Brachypodium distachyon TaxID=15368 RepID=A0A2K2CL61_BRADI|nr:hypothetical protein BRADI_4g07945v3 [Brachypodium distachyon]